MFSNDDRTDMILLTHYFCDFSCLLLLLKHILLRGVFFCQNLTLHYDVVAIEIAL
jgi:hypothetical protein